MCYSLFDKKVFDDDGRDSSASTLRESAIEKEVGGNCKTNQTVTDAYSSSVSSLGESIVLCVHGQGEMKEMTQLSTPVVRTMKHTISVKNFIVLYNYNVLFVANCIQCFTFYF